MSAGVDQGVENKKDKKVRSKKMNLRIDMAPMCDLGFLLITFFMFTTTFSKPNIMNLNMPPKIDHLQNIESPEIDIRNSITLVLGAENKIYWYQDELNSLTADKLNQTSYSASNGLRKVVMDAFNGAKDKNKFTVIIKPYEESSYQNVVDVLDEMDILKIERYGIKNISDQEISILKQK